MNAGQRPGGIREINLVVGIGLLAMTIRIAFSFVFFPYAQGPLELGVDPDGFGAIAQNWAEGNGFTYQEGDPPTTFRGPGYPLLLATVDLVFGNLFPAIVVIQCIIGALLCLVVYYIGKQALDSWVGSAAALVAALHPLLIWYSPRLRYEPLLTLLIALAILWLLRVQESRSVRDAFLVGLFFGCATLVSQIAILLPVTLFIGSVLLSAHRTSLVKSYIVALLTMVTAIVPWTLRNYYISGLIIPVHSGGVTQFVKGNYESEAYDKAPMQTQALDRMGAAYVAQLLDSDPDEFQLKATGVDQALLPHALSFVRNEPDRLLRKILVQVPRFWYLSQSPLKSWFLAGVQGILLLPALVGTFHMLRIRQPELLLPLLLPILYFNVLYAATHVEARYSTPIVPYVIILAVVGLRMIFGVLRKSHRRGADAD